MDKKYYIELLGVDLKRKWYFDNHKKRNDVYEKVKKQFEKDISYKVPVIEIDIGVEKPGETVTFPLRLIPEKRDEVISYINSIV